MPKVAADPPVPSCYSPVLRPDSKRINALILISFRLARRRAARARKGGVLRQGATAHISRAVQPSRFSAHDRTNCCRNQDFQAEVSRLLDIVAHSRLTARRRYSWRVDLERIGCLRPAALCRG